MSSLTVQGQFPSIEVQDVAGELVVDSRLIAERLGIQHEALVRTVNKYLTELQGFGVLRFENGKPQSETIGRPQRFCYLNEDQAILLMTMSRNTAQVVQCKVELVKAFEKAKQIIKTVIPAQNDRLRELELEVKLLELKGSLVTMHGKETALLLMGHGDKIVESDRPILEVIDQRTGSHFTGQTCKQVAEYVHKRMGKRIKSGAEVERILRKVGRDDLIEYVQRPARQACVPKNKLGQVYEILCSGDRQKLIGE